MYIRIRYMRCIYKILFSYYGNKIHIHRMSDVMWVSSLTEVEKMPPSSSINRIPESPVALPDENAR